MITRLARTDDLALRAGRPRALGTNRTGQLESECDERAYTYQQERRIPKDDRHGSPGKTRLLRRFESAQWIDGPASKS